MSPTIRVAVCAAAVGVVAAACGADDAPTGDAGPDSTIVLLDTERTTDGDTAAPDETPSPSPPGLRQIFDIDEVAGLWMPIEVDGVAVPTDVDAFLRISPMDRPDRIDLRGTDGCTGFRVFDLHSDGPVRFIDGVVGPIGAEMNALGCGPGGHVPTIPSTGATFWLDGSADVLRIEQPGWSLRLLRSAGRTDEE